MTDQQVAAPEVATEATPQPVESQPEPQVQAPQEPEAQQQAAPMEEREVPERPRSQAQARQAVAQRLAARRAAAAAAAEKPRDEQGRFVAQESEAAKAAPAPEAKQGEAAPQAAAPESQVAPTTGTVTIPVPENHPLREQGVTQFDDVPAHLERHMREMLNAAARRKEVEQALAAREAAEREKLLVEAKLAVLSSKGTPQVDPETQEMLRQVKEAFPDKAAELEAALEARKREQLSEMEREAATAAERQYAAHNFLRQVGQLSPQKYPVWQQSGELQHRMQSAVAQYGDYVDARNQNLRASGMPEQGPSAEEFFGWVDTNYVRDQRVQTNLRSFHEQRIAKEKTAAAAAERKRIEAEQQAKLQQAAERHAANPPTLPMQQSVKGTVPSAAPEAVAGPNRYRDLRTRVAQRYGSGR